MATSQRVSRGFHRLALFLAAVPLLIGVLGSVLWAIRDANIIASNKHQKLMCAYEWLDRIVATNGSADVAVVQELKAMGCSSWLETVSVEDILAAKNNGFSYAAAFALTMTYGLAITLAFALALYGLVRAIGWVIGGFAAS